AWGLRLSWVPPDWAAGVLRLNVWSAGLPGTWGIDMSMLRCCTAVLFLLSCSGALVAQGYTASTIPNAFATHSISATGTILPGGANLDDDGELVPFPAGFTFPFYGAVYDHVRVESNGWVYFGPDQNLTQVQRRDAPLVTPNSVLPNNWIAGCRSEEHTSELQSRENLVCRLLLEKKKKNNVTYCSI